jgi:hypothetical protein
MNQPDFENWVQQVFSGPEPSFFDLWDDAADCETTWQVGHATRLFQAPTFLLADFSQAQVAAGLFKLPSSWQLTDLLWNAEQDWATREACINAMYILYRDLFTITALDGVAFMWWDLLRYWGQDADPRTAKAIVLVLEQVLALPNSDCQLAALHGLGHYGAGRRAAIIDTFLANTPVSDELREYAVKAKAGDVL